MCRKELKTPVPKIRKNYLSIYVSVPGHTEEQAYSGRCVSNRCGYVDRCTGRHIQIYTRTYVHACTCAYAHPFEEVDSTVSVYTQTRADQGASLLARAQDAHRYPHSVPGKSHGGPKLLQICGVPQTSTKEQA